LMRHILRLAVLLGCFAVTPAFAQGSADQRAACQGDAYRLCDAYIPDAIAVEQCLRARMGSLSAACRAEFGGGGGKVAKKAKPRKRRR